MSKIKNASAKAFKVVQNAVQNTIADFTPETVDVKSPSGTDGPSLVRVLDLVSEWKLSICQYHAIEHILSGSRESMLRAIWFLEREIQTMEDK